MPFLNLTPDFQRRNISPIFFSTSGYSPSPTPPFRLDPPSHTDAKMLYFLVAWERHPGSKLGTLAVFLFSLPGILSFCNSPARTASHPLLSSWVWKSLPPRSLRSLASSAREQLWRPGHTYLTLGTWAEGAVSPVGCVHCSPLTKAWHIVGLWK